MQHSTDQTADLNEELGQRGVEREVTVQRICRTSKGEEEVNEALDEIWDSPENATSLLNKIAMKDRSIFDLKHRLAMPASVTGKIEAPVISPQTSSS
jgi:hypothetical protein